MLINKALIGSLNPCANRHQNYLNKYGSQEFTVDEFLDLKGITYDDKIWVARRLLTAPQARAFAILCAESVLPLFEAKYPDNKAPRDLIQYLKAINWLDVTADQWTEITRLRDAADAAYAYAAAADAAYAAAYAAADAAAADAAYAYAAAAAAAYAAAYAAADAADAAAASADAAYAAYAAADARKNQQELNLTYLKMAFSLGAD